MVQVYLSKKAVKAFSNDARYQQIPNYADE